MHASHNTATSASSALHSRFTDAQQVLAYMLYSIHSLAAHIARLAVCPLHRRAGHAKRLIQHVTRELQRARRISTFSLHVAAVNEPALALYKASGFKEDAFLQARPSLCGVSVVIPELRCYPVSR